MNVKRGIWFVISYTFTVAATFVQKASKEKNNVIICAIYSWLLS